MCERRALHPVTSQRIVRLGQDEEGWEHALARRAALQVAQWSRRRLQTRGLRRPLVAEDV